MASTRISSYTKILNGKPVRVNGYTVNRDAAAGALRVPGRPFVSAHPGQFPNERGLPNIFPLTEVHDNISKIDSNFDAQSAVKNKVEESARQAAQTANSSEPPNTSAKKPGKNKVSKADLVVQMNRIDRLVSDATVGATVDLLKVFKFLESAENILTAAEAGKTTARAMESLKAKR